MKFRTILNKNLRYLIGSQSFKISSLSDELGINRNTLSSYFNDKAIPTTFFLLKFAEKFQVSVDDLLKKDLTDPNFVAEKDADYGNLDKTLILKEKEIDLLQREIKIRDRELELKNKEMAIYKRIAQDCEKHQQHMQEQLENLEYQLKATGLLSGKKDK